VLGAEAVSRHTGIEWRNSTFERCDPVNRPEFCGDSDYWELASKAGVG
jgi:hypothetical protein